MSEVRGRQVKPTKAEIDHAWMRLRERADEGNLLACGLVIALTGDRSQITGSMEFVTAAAEIGELLVSKIQGLPDDV